MVVPVVLAAAAAVMQVQAVAEDIPVAVAADGPCRALAVAAAPTMEEQVSQILEEQGQVTDRLQ